MKFIFDRHGYEAVNIDFVKKIFVERVFYRDGESTEAHVTAEIVNGPEVVLKIFDSNSTEENLKAAQAYLAELVEKLNEVTK